MSKKKREHIVFDQIHKVKKNIHIQKTNRNTINPGDRIIGSADRKSSILLKKRNGNLPTTSDQ